MRLMRSLGCRISKILLYRAICAREECGRIHGRIHGRICRMLMMLDDARISFICTLFIYRYLIFSDLTDPSCAFLLGTLFAAHCPVRFDK